MNNPDNPSNTGDPADRILRGHLKDPSDGSHRMYRYPAPADIAGLLSAFWIPVWSVPAGSQAPQRVLQYPVCLIVVTPEYARFYGVTLGMSTTTLAGDGWAAGVMLTPAAGFLLAGGSVEAYTDTHADLEQVVGDRGRRLTAGLRAAMAPGPHAESAHRSVIELYRTFLRSFGPIDDEGRLINDLVDYVESDPTVLRVAQLADRFGLTERGLQRLVRRRLGLTPKWLIQRRRLQEAAQRLRERSADPAELAFLLGYADQPHFIRDFRRVTTMTPGEFAARYRP